ncbi:ATP-binding cassette domain-containing protein [Actinomadura viridis]|uniref:ABC transport system ATP-binding protein n=1 Tax=Actinomadura viridis TaxID=58110 RepID=A0A931DHH7_9ACTN|nr:ATP-binding cassette domain-containing protein [Actinomadura viridis]MBG6086828.1 putative ABC transport system ATP-binding protein [Actinomadura viridis]
MAAYTTGLTKTYDPSDRPALDNVNVAFRAGELCAIMGPPGAGKSTLLACLAGHEPPSVGKVYVGRGDARPWLPQQVRQICRGEVGFVLSHSRPFPGRTVLENLEWAAALAGRPDDIARAERVAGILGLLEDLHTPAGHLPADLQHLTMCAAALLPDPSVLLVDESDTGPLSASTLAVLRRCTAELGTTVVAVTGSPEAAALADRVVFLATGRVAGIITRPAEDVVHELREIFAGRHASRSYVPEQGGPPASSSASAADPGPPERQPADA